MQKPYLSDRLMGAYSINSTYGVDFLEDFVSTYGNEDEKTIAKPIRKLCMKFKISEYM